MDALGKPEVNILYSERQKEEHIDNINAYCVGLSYHRVPKGLVP